MDDAMKTCLTCRHWYAEQNGTGVCSRITLESDAGAWLNLGIIDPWKRQDVGPCLETDADFSCALWEEE